MLKLIILASILGITRGYYYCTDTLRVEPRVSDVISHLVPEVDVDSFLKMLNEEFRDGQINTQWKLLNATLRTASMIGSVPLPFRSMISDGVFTVDLKERKFSFNDIYLVQENYFTLSFLCESPVVSYFSFLRPWICNCFHGEDFRDNSNSNHHFVGYGDLDSRLSKSRQWCVSRSPVCTSRQVGESCQVRVDPLRSSCIWIKQHLDEPDSDPVHYKLTVPTILERFPILSVVGNNLNNAVRDLPTTSETVKRVVDFYHRVLSPAMHWAASHTSVYLAFMVVGLAIIFIAEDLSANGLFQYTTVSLFGLALFLTWLAFVFYVATENLARKNVPYVGTLVAPMLAATTIFTGQSLLKDMAINALQSFWFDGALGYPWLGQVVFASTMLLSVFVAWFFGIFRRDPKTFTPTTGEKFLHWMLYILGVILLSQCTSSFELSVLFLVLGLNWEWIEYLCYRISMSLSAMESSAGAKTVSAATLERVVASHTERELAKLQTHLSRNKLELDRLYPQNSPRRAMMFRFADGDTSGLPFQHRRFGTGASSSDTSTLYRVTVAFLKVVIILAALAGGVVLFLQKFGSGSNYLEL